MLIITNNGLLGIHAQQKGHHMCDCYMTLHAVQEGEFEVVFIERLVSIPIVGGDDHRW